MVRLVINADDLGLHSRIDEGIFFAHREGIVTSASLLATGPSAPSAAKKSREVGLPLGVHLCLASALLPAAPVDEVPTVAPGGRFRRGWPQVLLARALGRLRASEVRRELEAQVALARKLGAEVDHLDGHQHLHALPGVVEVVKELAHRERLPIRWPSESARREWLLAPWPALKVAAIRLATTRTRPNAGTLDGWGIFEAGRLTQERLLRLMRALPDGDWEIGCHPGFHPGEVPEEPGWRYSWEAELEGLCSPEARRLVLERGIRLTTYGELFKSPPP